jgi:hypothetical protein
MGTQWDAYGQISGKLSIKKLIYSYLADKTEPYRTVIMRTPSPPLPCREPAIGRPQARKAPSSRAIFQMPSEPRRLGDVSKAVSERLLSLITRTSPSAVRVQNSLRLQRFGPIDGPEVRGRYSTQCAVRETEVEVLARNSGRAWPVRPDGNRQPDRPL